MFTLFKDENLAQPLISFALSQTTLEALHSDALFESQYSSYGDVGSALLNGECEAAIMQKVDFDTLLTNGCNCKMSVVGASDAVADPKQRRWRRQGAHRPRHQRLAGTAEGRR